MTNSSNSPHGTLGTMFEALSQPTRRRILTVLADANPRGEGEFVPTDFSSEERREEEITRLHHVHLPKLDEAGFIDWNPNSKVITRGPRFDEIAPLLELMITHRDELPADWL